jgi:Calcineurin-like phosphoesterase
MRQAIFLLFLCCYCSACGANRPVPLIFDGQSADISRAGADGPHVFYRNNKIMVKSVVLNDSIAEGRKAVYREKDEVLLTCTVPETGDSFSFGLQDSLTLPPTVWPKMPARMLVLSDIEGNFAAFKTMLLGAKIIDDKFNWTFGNGHLVLLGDYFDRGLQVTECLWLCYKLEAEAKAAGGVVHFILGNHEIMNMANDTRYVRNKYFENAELINEEYSTWFNTQTELGLWLRSRNAVEQIGDHIFCHGGISMALANSRMNLSDVNRIARRWYGTPVKKINDPDAMLIFNEESGIFWYRDMARKKMKLNDVEFITQHYGINRIVIGHTLQADLTAHYGGKVICIDLLHEENMRMGVMKTLWIEDSLIYGLTSKGEKSSVFTVTFGQKTKSEE